MAAAAVELAERHQRKGSKSSTWIRRLAIAVIFFCGPVAVFAAVEGDFFIAIAMGFTVAIHIWQLLFNPAARPRDVARSLEASRRVLASEG